MITLTPQPLTAQAFAPFGDVIETQDRDFFLINNGSTKRYHQLTKVDLDEQGSAIISIFRATPLTMPLPIMMLEKHPLGSQAFIPMQGSSFLIVVAPESDTVDPTEIKAFISHGKQGINYRKNVWHHPILALNNNDDFLVVDRTGLGNNCDEFYFSQEQSILLSP
ncbi:ureidoglycolate lyase [Neptunomonas japonica]|uniref:ureidoglycolate lyase n=1 Tax=Neptunomonas japonica TaxID=417574 RepID=UPI00042811C3|nr:ureidoglycolate lyase [Neptunomonas japonica]